MDQGKRQKKAPTPTDGSTGTTKVVRTIRIDPDGADYIAKRAKRADVSPSVMTRRMLKFAAIHMPEGWVPPINDEGGGQ